jgi:hypothetical protein
VSDIQQTCSGDAIRDGKGVCMLEAQWLEEVRKAWQEGYDEGIRVAGSDRP